MPACFVLPNLQIKFGLSSRQAKQDCHRPSIYAAWDKRWITRYVVQRYRCLSCRSTFYPCDRGWTASKYGPNLAAYTVYQNIELGLPQSRVASSVKQL